MRPLIGSALLVFFTLLPALPVPAQETPATREEIFELLELMHTRDMTRQAMQMMASRVRDQLRSVPGIRDSGVPEDILARLGSLIETLMDEMIREYPMEQILDDMVPVYQKYMTSADVQAMITFYSTPTGQKVIRDMPAIMAESMQISQPHIQRQMQRFQEKVMEATREMIEEIRNRRSPEF